MRKINLLLFVFIALVSCSSTKTTVISNTTEYNPIKEGLSWKYRYATSKSYFTDRISVNKMKLQNNDYFLRIRTYSNGDVDTLYYRIENNSAIYLNKKTMLESVELPGAVEENQKWYSTDSAYIYQITDVDAKLQTPKKVYKHLIELKAQQYATIDSTRDISEKYYFAKGIGLVGVRANGVLKVYHVKR
jgi:hypothetical protein